MRCLHWLQFKKEYMNTKILMTSSSLLLALTGIAFSFFPKEILTYLNIDTNTLTILLLQILSALFLGFAILNWMAKGSLIGGSAKSV